MENMDREKLKELYETDFALWALINADLLSQRKFDLLDLENLVEEVRDIAMKAYEKGIGHLTSIFEHFYKLDHLMDFAENREKIRDWIRQIEIARNNIEAEFSEYPSLKEKLPGFVRHAWIDAWANLRIWLEREGHDSEKIDIPKECPYTIEQAFDRNVREEFRKYAKTPLRKRLRKKDLKELFNPDELIEACIRLEALLEKHPELRKEMPRVVEQAWDIARRNLETELGEPVPEKCPYIVKNNQMQG